MKGPQRAPLQPTERPAVKRIFFLVIAWISLALGCIGVFVPLLPTTPLVILATFLFAKSSPRLHAWICKTRVYGAYVKPFKERGGITLARKLQILGLSYAVMGVSAFFMRNVIAWAVLGVVALFLAWLVAVRIPTISNEEAATASYPTATMHPSDEITSIRTGMFDATAPTASTAPPAMSAPAAPIATPRAPTTAPAAPAPF